MRITIHDLDATDRASVEALRDLAHGLLHGTGQVQIGLQASRNAFKLLDPQGISVAQLDAANLTSSSVPMSGEAPGEPDYGTPDELADQHEPGPPPQGDVAEEANTRTPDDGLPRHPDGRIVGRAPEGKKRRTKAQIAEDEAWEAAQSANEASDRAPVSDEPEPEGTAIIPPTQEQPFQAPPQQGFSGPADESHAAADEHMAQPPAPPAPPAPAPSSPFNF